MKGLEEENADEYANVTICYVCSCRHQSSCVYCVQFKLQPSWCTLRSPFHIPTLCRLSVGIHHCHRSHCTVPMIATSSGIVWTEQTVIGPFV